MMLLQVISIDNSDIFIYVRQFTKQVQLNLLYSKRENIKKTVLTLEKKER